IQYYQKELLKLYSNKQSYLKPTGQIALFGTLPIFKTLKEAKKYFKAWAYTHLRGKKVFHKELDKFVVFSSKGIDHVLSSKISLKKMYLIQQAEEMLKNSHLIAFAEDYKGRDNIKGAYRMRTKATFEGEELKVILTLREGENGVIYYDHKIEEIEESTTPPRKSHANPFCGDSAPTNIPAKTMPNTSANKQINKLAVPIKEKSTTPPRRGRAKSFCGDSAPTNTPAKTMPNTLANRQIDKLANPIMPPTVYVEHLPEISTSVNQNTLDAKMAALQTRNWETFVIANPQLQRFLGDVERKTSESTVITIAGGAGSGKTRFAFQFISALAQNYKVGHASLEEHPDSKLYYDKVQQYIDETALPNIEAPEIKNLDQLEALIQRNEVIVIDSFAKLQELNPRFLLDRDLRKKYDGKLFLLIYQLTGEGKMRGGSKSEYDGDIILLTHVALDYRENYIYPSKNRYNALPATQLRYSTYYQQMLDIPKELGTGSRPPEAISLPPAPQTNVYEVIY
uniref:LPD3 domain-containing protein n=1 Tax=Capnocytophaga leadbetteri TaxID=327575 RepID=UPI003C6FC7CE